MQNSIYWRGLPGHAKGACCSQHMDCLFVEREEKSANTQVSTHITPLQSACISFLAVLSVARLLDGAGSWQWKGTMSPHTCM